LISPKTVLLKTITAEKKKLLLRKGQRENREYKKNVRKRLTGPAPVPIYVSYKKLQIFTGPEGFYLEQKTCSLPTLPPPKKTWRRG
jgi:hypothetical protein